MTRFLNFFRSPLFPIFMIVFVDVLGVGITLPVLPLYAQNLFGASATQITLLTSVYFLAQFFASPQLGRLSDRVGRRPVLILSQAGTFIAFVLSGWAPLLWVLYLARTIDGITGGNISVAQAYLSDITDTKNRARGLGIVNAAFGSGFVFGPAFGALVAAQFGPRVPFFIAAGVSLVTITLTYFMLPESLTPERRQRDIVSRAGRPAMGNLALMRIPSVALIAVIAFVSQFGFFAFQPTYVLWSERVLFPNHDTQYVQTTIGWILTFVGVCGIITQFWLVGPLVRRFGEKSMVVGGNVLRGFAWVVMVALPSLAFVVAATPLLAIGGGVSIPALAALITYAAPPDQRGQAIGLLEAMQGLGRVLGPVVAGQLFERVSPSAPMVMAATLSFVAALIALNLWRLNIARHDA